MQSQDLQKDTSNFKTLLLISLTSIVFSLFFVEITLRAYFNFTNSRTTLIWRDDQIVGRRLVSNQNGLFVSPQGEYKTKIQINSEGWHDIEHKTEKPADTFRILILGDSFVENFQVPLPETFFRQLENKLNEKSIYNKKIEIIAIGLGDTGTAQQLIAFNEYGIKYQPDLVLHAFFNGNDIKNNSSKLQSDQFRPYFSLDNGRLVYIPFITRSQNNGYKLIKLIKDKSLLVETILNVKGSVFSKKTSDYPIDYHVYDQNYSQDYTLAWDLTYKLLQELNSRAISNNSDYLFVSIPANEQINDNVLAEVKNEYPIMNEVNLDMQKPDKLLSDFCKNENINCLFLNSKFKNYYNEHKQPVHFVKDGHLNNYGNQLLIEELEKALTSYFTIK